MWKTASQKFKGADNTPSNFLKAFYPKILLGPFLNTSTHLTRYHIFSALIHKIFHRLFLYGLIKQAWEFHIKVTLDNYTEHCSLSTRSFIYYVRKNFWKTNISYSLIHTRTYTYQGVRNIFSENFAYILHQRSLPINSDRNMKLHRTIIEIEIYMNRTKLKNEDEVNVFKVECQ